MTNHLHCATCGTHVHLTGQTVACPKCRVSLPLIAAILTIETQASRIGQTLDVQSIRADAKGQLIYGFQPKRKPRATRENVA